MKFIFIFLYFFVTVYAEDRQFLNLEKIKLQLQWKHQFEFAGFYAAKEKGFYRDVGLDVEFIQKKSKTNIVNEVLTSSADYGLTDSSLLIDYMKKKPIVFVANFFKQSPLVLVTQKDIHSPLDLKNTKKIGFSDNSHKQLILTMLNKFNISTEKYKKSTIQDFINKEVDAISVFSTNEIFALNKLGIKYNILNPVDFGTKFYDLNLFTSKKELINSPNRIERFKQASIKGWEYALNHKNELINIITKKYNTQHKSKEALLFEANQVEYLMLTKVYPIGSINLDQLKIIADNFSDSISMDKISKNKLESFIYKSDSSFIDLTKEEKEYLRNKKELKMCVNPNWLPLEKIQQGKHIGIAAEFMHLISQKLRIPIRLIPTSTWDESLEKIEQRQCDILSLAEQTAKKKKYLDFTSAYIKMPLVIATRVGLPFINNLNKIKGKSIGFVKHYSIEELLRNEYPGINLVEVTSISEGLLLVDRDKIFGFIDNSLAINTEIQKNNMSNIGITGQSSKSFNLSIASRNDEPILNKILEKILISIDDRTRNTFMQKWNNIKYQVQPDYKLILQTLFFGIVLVSIFIYWNLKLKEEIKNKEEFQKKLKESEEKFRTLFEEAPILLDAFDKNGRVQLWNKECEKVFGWSFKEISEVDDPLDLFYPDALIKKEIMKGFNTNHNSFKDWYSMTKDGKTIITRWANIKLPNNEIIHIGFDITKQRSNEIAIKEKTQELKLAKKELEDLNISLENKIKDEIKKNTEQQMILMQQSKLVQMGEMIENIAHQWRQPLAEINSIVLLIDQELTKNNFLDENMEEKLSEIESITHYMSGTINDFKNFFDTNKKKETFNIYKNVIKTLNIINKRISYYEIKVDLNMNKEREIFGYSNELNQVLLIVINNSIDAFIQRNIVNPLITISLKENKESIILYIKDNALGIDNQIINKVFDPYFSTKHKSQGTGLGLYISKMIIEKSLNGKILMLNEKDGICIIIEIPQGKD